MGRKLSRNVWKTRGSSSQKRSEPAALRGQGGNEHGGSPWFQGGVEPGRAPAGEGRELLTPWVDERVRSLSHRGAVSFKTNFSPALDGRAVEKTGVQTAINARVAAAEGGE